MNMAAAAVVIVLGVANMTVEIAQMDIVVCVTGFQVRMAIFAFRQLSVCVSLFDRVSITVQLAAVMAVDAFIPV
jgi:hypothetical protein